MYELCIETPIDVICLWMGHSFKLIIQIRPLDLAVKMISRGCLTSDKSTWVQVMACHQGASYYMSQRVPALCRHMSSIAHNELNCNSWFHNKDMEPKFCEDIWNHWHSKYYGMDIVYGSSEIIKIHTGFTRGYDRNDNIIEDYTLHHVIFHFISKWQRRAEIGNRQWPWYN